MNLNISGHHLALTPPLREYVTEKLKRLERQCDRLIKAEVILSVEKLRHKAEATLHARGADLHAEAVVEADMYAAIDALVDKLAQQTRRHTGKLGNHHAGQHDKRQTLQ